MFRIIKIESNNKTYFVSLNAIVKITPIFGNQTEKNKATSYSISFVDGSFLDNCKLSDDIVTELHLG